MVKKVFEILALGKPRKRWRNDSKTDLGETGWDDIKHTDLDRNEVQRCSMILVVVIGWIVDHLKTIY
jgi:hypothetical protein